MTINKHVQGIVTVDLLDPPPAAAHAQRRALDKTGGPAARASGLGQSSGANMTGK
ncbi:MAG: hypothetical protein JKY36_08770, partial [Erythrobacter sp.]|nr:hypothetical protein [Erythrobacter sp.]